VAQKELNLGILAHVDAGKTTLTERLLYEAGAIDEIGSVDDGTTLTDSLELEQKRGITIRSAVASFVLNGVHVNLIDTPGHPDFIAEVERVLSVLDGAVLVISAVEGVQPQTRILMRALQRLRIPTLLFVNKIDRPGAGDERVLRMISERLTTEVAAMGSAHELGTGAASFRHSDEDDPGFRTRLAELLAERDEAILASYVEDEADVSYQRLRDALAHQTSHAFVHPVYFGSSRTGAGVNDLMTGIAELLPAADGDPEGALSGTIFKIERGANGEKIAYVRLFSGTIRTRDRLRFAHDFEDKVTAIEVFERGPAVQRPSVSAGAVARLWGLANVRVGDRLGETEAGVIQHQFPPPTLESVVVAANSDDRARLRIALAQLAEQDPLINVRQDDTRQEISVSLYGEVQKEVIQSTLADDFDLVVAFREVTPIYIERLVGSGDAVEILHADSNPFLATIGLRVEPAPFGSGLEFRMRVDHTAIPLYIYKTADSFRKHMAEYVRDALQQGPYGWRVTDLIVTLTSCAYSVPDGPPSRRGPLSTAADFRKLAPLVLMQALGSAGTVVCEPVVRVSLEIPTATLGAVTAALARLGAGVEKPSMRGTLPTIETILPASRADELQRRLAGLTGGEGVLESGFAGYQPVSGEQPRRRTAASAFDFDE
jgi:ribosomal protection tetracycline resistance protein